MHCLLHYFDTLSIDKKHNSQNVLHVVTKAHILFQLTLNREWGGGPEPKLKYFTTTRLYCTGICDYQGHACTCDFLRSFEGGMIFRFFNLSTTWNLTFQYLGQLWSEMSKNIPSNYVINDQASNLSAIWSCVH